MTSNIRKGTINRTKFSTLFEDDKNPKNRTTPTTFGKNIDLTKLFKYIDENVIGRNTTFLGPYGRRKVVYCDYATSGRALHFIEDYIQKEVLPLYGDTHTSTNITSQQMTSFREEAIDMIKNAVHATEDDVVIFSGHGCTSALHKLIHALDLTNPPVVFVGSSEHESVLLPWIEVGSKVIRISETKDGVLDLVDLEKKLRFHRSSVGENVRFIGCFNVASNVTGIITDDVATTILLHQYNALAFWDYTVCAPYVSLNMNPILPGNDKTAYKDAMFFTGHVFPGGVQTPGVLVAKKDVFQNDIPEACEGENISFISSTDDLRYNQELREECGIGSIVETIRMGLAMHLKQTVSSANIIHKEQMLTRTVLSFIQSIPEIILLGETSSSNNKRLAIFSFMVKHPRATFLHHNFICAILNDVFGIQATVGCLCDTKYAYDLLAIDQNLAEQYENILNEDNRSDGRFLRRPTNEILRPGFTRLSLPYFISEMDLSFVLEAIKMVVTEGWKLLPQYVLNPETGQFRHKNNASFRDRKLLSSMRYTDGKMAFSERKVSGQSPFPQDASDCLKMARSIFNKARKNAQQYPLIDQSAIFDENAENLRWFMLPSEAHNFLLANCQNVKTSVPFNPSERPAVRSVYKSTLSPHAATNQSLIFRHNSMSSICTQRPRSDSGSPSRYFAPVSRTRCYSLESNGARNKQSGLSRCSCSGQSETDSKNNYSEVRDTSLSSIFSQASSEDIQAFVKEVTEELATEIKSEIREVIATVDGALLENNESSTKVDNSSESSNTSEYNEMNTSSSSKTVTDHVATYLAELTSEMLTEMKSEFRQMVDTVDEMISEQKPAVKCRRKKLSRKENVVKRASSLENPVTIAKEGSSDSSVDSGVISCEDVKKNDKIAKRKFSMNITNEKKILERRKTSLDFSSWKNVEWHRPNDDIWKPTLQAIEEFDMIRKGDRVLVSLTGGKDSLSLLHTLHFYKCYCESKKLFFELGAIIVDPGGSTDPRSLLPYLNKLKIPYIYEEQEKETDFKSSSIRSFSSFLEKSLYKQARKHEYNVLAFGQHLDDVAESFIMSIFHNGKLRSMKAHYVIGDGNLRVIRPFVFVREKSLKIFSENSKLPVVLKSGTGNFKEGYRIKQLLAHQEILHPSLFENLRSSILPFIGAKDTDNQKFEKTREEAVFKIASDTEEDELHAF